MEVGYQIPYGNRIARSIFRPIFRGLFHILGQVEITGKENIPESGAYIVAQNHISTYDSPFVLVFWPKHLEAAGARAVWDRPFQSILARMYGGIKVHRGQFDRKLIDRLILALQSGYPLLIAPEGGRSGRPGMRRAKPGVAYLAQKSKVPVIPVGVHGSGEEYFREAMKGRRPLISMCIGKPIHLPLIEGRGKTRRFKLQENSDLIMSNIAALLPLEYGGVYVKTEES